MGVIGTRDSILAANDLPKRAVDVPEWGATVYVRSMTGDERDGWEQWLLDTKDGTRRVRARYCALVMVDAEGARLFDDTDSDIEALGRKSASALDRVFSAALSLNGMAAGDQETAEGN